MITRFSIPLLCLASIVNGYRPGEWSRPGNSSDSNSTSENLSGIMGDSRCGTSMCISATVNDTHVTYVMQSTGSNMLGWIGMGFGQTMANSPMVLAWVGSNGVILSQRTAPGHAMPTVDSNPPRAATLLNELTTTSGSQPKFAFSVPSDGTTNQWIIYAFGSTVPDSAVDASIVRHIDNGAWQFNLAGTIESGTANNPASSPSNAGSSDEGPWTSHQKILAAHAILCVLGFLLFLPAGALLARYLRTFWPRWFTAHWIVQFGLAGPVVITGIALGIAAVGRAGAPHLDNTHKKWGIAILVLFVVQCALGAIIHFFKPQPPSYRSHPAARRPLQNYLHAIIGLAIIAFALYQVRTGYTDEWPNASGRGDLGSGVNIVWHIWVVLLPVLYFLGLALLPRQFKQEAKGSRKIIGEYDEDRTINR